jgi:hypothetical protein
MKKLLTTAALLAGFATGAANADQTTFDFTYNFTDGEMVTGSFQGLQNGNLINNVDNIEIAFNGVQFIGPLVVAGWNPTTLNWDSAPVVSTVATMNNFVFADADFSTVIGQNSWSNEFYFTNDATYGTQVSAVNLNALTNNAATDYALGTWTVTAVAAVPVPAALPLMVSGLGVLLAAGRRRLSV